MMRYAILSLMVVLGLMQVPVPHAGAQPPSVGDWTVSGTETFSGSAVVTGNITVSTGAVLTLDNAVISMNSTADVTYHIEVRPGGRLVMKNSTIKPHDLLQRYRYSFVVRFGGALRMYDSSLIACGSGNQSDPKTYGLYLESGNVEIVNSRITRTNPLYISAGVVLGPGASPLIKNTNISLEAFGILSLAGGSPVIENCTFSGNGVALSGMLGRFTIHSSTLQVNGVGAAVQGTELVIENTTFSRNSVAVQGSHTKITVTDSHLTSGTDEVRINTSSSLHALRTTFYNGIVLDASDMNLTDSAAGPLTLNSSSGSLLNTTFSEAELVLGTASSLDVMWYADVCVVRDSGADASGAVITASDATGTATHQRTYSGGYQRLVVTSVHYSDEGNTSMNPYTFRAALSGFRGENTTYVNSSMMVVIPIDDILPEVAVTSPENGSIFTARNITVSGTAQDNRDFTLNVTLNGEVLNTTGAAEWEAHASLQEGENTITALVTDAMGNSASASVTVFLDTTPPLLNITSPENGSLTNSTAVAVRGTTDGVRVASGNLSAVPENGTFSLEVPLAEGENTVEVCAYDAVNNSRCMEIVITADWTPPEITVEGVPDITNESTVVFTVNLSESADITVENLTWTSQSSAAVNLSLEDGAHTLNITAVDAAGNVNTTSITVVVDTQPPEISVHSPDRDLVNTSTVTVEGSISGAEDLWVQNMSVSITNGSFSAEVQLQEGENTLVLRAVDAAGNWATVRINITLDTQPPIILITAPEDGAEVHDERVVVKGCTVGAVSAEVNGVAVNASAFNVTLELQKGENTITVRAWDAAGNAAVKSITVVYTAPAEETGATTSTGYFALITVAVAVALVLLAYRILRGREDGED